MKEHSPELLELIQEQAKEMRGGSFQAPEREVAMSLDARIAGTEDLSLKDLVSDDGTIIRVY